MKRMHLLDDTLFYKNLFMLALPIMLQNLVNSLVNIVSMIMIGQLGTVAIASVGLGNQVFFLLNMILFGVGSGGAVFTAQYWGKKDYAGIRKTTGLCLAIVLGISTLFTVLCLLIPRTIIGFYSIDPSVIESGGVYLRTVAPCFIPFSVSFIFTLIMRTIEKVKLSMITTVIALSINVALSYILIFGIGPFPAMGVMGAALATVIARCIELVIILSVSYGRKYILAGSLGELFWFNPQFSKRFFQIAFPVIINELLWSLGVTMQNVIFARTHTDAIAAFNITNTLSQLTWVVFIGLGNGASVLIGKKIGEGSDLTARDYARRITRFAPLLAIGIALILIPLSWVLPFFFRVNDTVLSITGGMFLILAVSYPFRAFNMSMVIGVCRAGGDTLFSVFYDIIFMWFLALPLAALSTFVFHAPVWIIYLCITSEEPFKALLGHWRLRSGKWLHNVT